MTDNTDEVQCKYCGDWFKSQGLGTHQRYCDSTDSDNEDDTGDSILDDPSGVEQRALDRDEESSFRCGAEAELTVHTVNSDVGQQLNNLLTLCEDCEELVSGLHPRTKRTIADEL